MRQLLVLICVVFLACPVWAGISDSDFVQLDCVSAPLNKDTGFTLLVSLNTKTRAQGLVVPLTFAGNANLTIDTLVGTKGVTQQTLGSFAGWSVRTVKVDNTAKTILLAYISFGSPLPASTGPLARINFKLAATSTADLVDVDSTLIAPSNRLAISDPSAVTHTPQFTKGLIAIGQSCGGGGGVSDSDFVDLDCVSAPLDKDTSFTLLVSLSTKTSAQGIVVPLTFAGNASLTVDTTAGTKGITQQTLGSNPIWSVKGATVNNTAKTILVYYLSAGSPLPPSNGPLVRIHFRVAATGTSDLVDVDSTLIAPSNHLAISDPSAVTHTPQFTKGLIAIGQSCPGTSVPQILNLAVGYPEDPLHVTADPPPIDWRYFDGASLPQTAYEIECGTDNDWAVAELWQPGVILSADTQTTYGGSPLQDGITYYCRARVSNGVNASGWVGTSFHTNAPPTSPGLSSPTADALVLSLTPELTVVNAIDADPLQYEFRVYADSALSVPLSGAPGIPSGVGQTMWTSGVLPDNTRAWWRARAHDGYENGPWSPQASFWIDGVPELPSVVELISPPDGADAEPTGTVFEWHRASDPDPFDTLAYRLQIGLDEAFLSSTTFDAVPETTFTPPEPLTGGTLYFWRVFCLDRRSSDSSVSSVFDFTVILPGDMNGDGRITSADVIRLVNYTFKGGPPPDPVYIGDVNADCKITSSDIIYVVNFVFKGGAAPLKGCAE